MEDVIVDILVTIMTPIINLIDMVLPMEFIKNGMIEPLAIATYETLNMTLVTGVAIVILGTILGIAVVVTKKGGIMENAPIAFVLDKFINFFRSVPFVILIALLVVPSTIIMGTYIGILGTYVPLVLGTVPFFARQIESSLMEVEDGLVEASEAMGCSPMQIIYRVYLKESIPSIVRGTSITLISLIGLTAMAGQVGGGGLGSFAIRFGYQRQMVDATWSTVVIILIIVTIIQGISNYIVKKTTH